MRLLEAIIEANHRAVAGDSSAGLRPAEFADSLPIAALTCIDPRLNPLIPEVLGVPEELFIWVRNAGNIVTGQFSSTMRSLAVATLLKGAKEIAIIGHTDCIMGKTTIVQSIDKLRTASTPRNLLPENLVDFFGIFSTESANVIKACHTVRNSPLISPQIPVHGLLVDIQTGKLEWLVNGYQTVGTTAPDFADSLKVALDKAQAALGPLSEFKIGDIKFPQTKIGQFATQAQQWIQKIGEAVAAPTQAESPKEPAVQAAKDFARHIVKTQLYRIIGSDKRQYGPITGEKLLRYLAEERINGQTPVQIEGSQEWVPLEKIGELARQTIPVPPPIQTRSTPRIPKP